LGSGITRLCGLAKPPCGCITLLGRLAQPTHCLRIVLPHVAPLLVRKGETYLRRRKILFRRAAKPTNRFIVILGRARALFEHPSDMVLGFSISLLTGKAE
jgi:hypothetical protein